MLKIGLTGGIASGKSIVAQLFREHGVNIIDADKISHEITQPNTDAYQAIVKHFGESILDQKQNLNRQALRQIVFSNSAERQWLEQLLHPIILEEMVQQAEQSTSDYCILVIPLLVEANAKHYVDRICVVDCPEELQIKRATDRDQTQVDAIKQIISSQANRQQRLAIADDVIENDKDIAHLQSQVDHLHTKYQQLSKQK